MFKDTFHLRAGDVSPSSLAIDARLLLPFLSANKEKHDYFLSSALILCQLCNENETMCTAKRKILQCLFSEPFHQKQENKNLMEYFAMKLIAVLNNSFIYGQPYLYLICLIQNGLIYPVSKSLYIMKLFQFSNLLF